MANPPLSFPSVIHFFSVAPGTSASSGGGGLLQVAGDVAVRIDGDDSGVFSVATLETQALVHNPDAPPHAPRVWETVTTVDGPGPISMEAASALLITVAFACPADPQKDAFGASAVVVASGTRVPLLLQVPISAIVDSGRLTIEPRLANDRIPSFSAGQTSNIGFRISSSIRRDVSGIFTCDPPPGPTPNTSPFSSDTEPQFPTVPARGSIDVVLAVTCARGTAAGNYDVAFRFDDIERNVEFGVGVLTIKVIATGANNGNPEAAARDAIAQEAAQNGFRLGAATSGVQSLQFFGSSDVFVQHYEHGSIFYSPATGAHEVNGEISAKYDFLGGPAASQIGLSQLGLPITDEKNALDGVGRVSDFENGSIYWHPRTGPMLNHSILKTAYAASGFEIGPLGYPTTDTHVWKTPDAQPRLAWGLFENGCIASNFKSPAMIVAGLNLAQIKAEDLKTLVRHLIDKKIHAHDIHVGLQPNIDIISVSDWQHGFESTARRAITYRLFAFRDTGLVLPDLNFAFDVTIRFGWASDATSLFDGPSRTLVAELVGDVVLVSAGVEGVDLLLLFGQIHDSIGADFAALEVATVPVELRGANPPLRVILEMIVTKEGAMQFKLNPFGSGNFGPDTQNQIDSLVDVLLAS